MTRSLVAMYLAAGIGFSSLAVEHDRHRCVEQSPGVYIFLGAVWPAVSVITIAVQLYGSHTKSSCDGAAQ